MEFKIENVKNKNGDVLKYRGNQVKQVTLKKKNKKGYSRDVVVEQVNDLNDELKELGFNGSIMVTLNHGGRQYYSGRFTDIQTEEPDIFHLNDYGNENAQDPEHYADFIIYVTKYKDNKETKTKEPKLKGGSIEETDEVTTDEIKPTKTVLKAFGYSLSDSKILINRRKPNGKCDIYADGELFENKDNSYVKNIENKPRTSGYLVVHAKKDDKRPLKEIYDEFIKTADILKEKTNGKINLYRTGSTTNTSKYHFIKFNEKRLIECETIIGKEEKWISDATMGALQHAIKYEGVSYGLDVNSFYAFILNSNFRIPIRQGKYETATFQYPFKSHVTYGIYRVTITGNINKFLFRKNPCNVYTSIDINRAIKLGY